MIWKQWVVMVAREMQFLNSEQLMVGIFKVIEPKQWTMGFPVPWVVGNAEAIDCQGYQSNGLSQ